jgi:hypothetical protein
VQPSRAAGSGILSSRLRPQFGAAHPGERLARRPAYQYVDDLARMARGVSEFFKDRLRCHVHVARAGMAGEQVGVSVGVEVQRLAAGRRRIKFDGSQEAESGRLESERESAAAREQIEDAGCTRVEQPRDFLIVCVVGYHGGLPALDDPIL